MLKHNKASYSWTGFVAIVIIASRFGHKAIVCGDPPPTHLRHACMDSESLHGFLGDFSFVDFFLLDKDSSFLHEWKTFSIRLAEVCKVLSCSADNLCCSLNMHIIEK